MHVEVDGVLSSAVNLALLSVVAHGDCDAMVRVTRLADAVRRGHHHRHGTARVIGVAGAGGVVRRAVRALPGHEVGRQGLPVARHMLALPGITVDEGRVGAGQGGGAVGRRVRRALRGGSKRGVGGGEGCSSAGGRWWVAVPAGGGDRVASIAACGRCRGGGGGGVLRHRHGWRRRRVVLGPRHVRGPARAPGAGDKGKLPLAGLKGGWVMFEAFTRCLCSSPTVICPKVCAD